MASLDAGAIRLAATRATARSRVRDGARSRMRHDLQIGANLGQTFDRQDSPGWVGRFREGILLFAVFPPIPRAGALTGIRRPLRGSGGGGHA